MAFPLFAKILGGVVAVGAIGVPAAYGINEYVLKDKGVQENEGELEEQQSSLGESQHKTVDADGGRKKEASIQCKNALDGISKSIKVVFITNGYLESDWTKKSDSTSLSTADKDLLTQETTRLENLFKENGACIEIKDQYGTKVSEIVTFLKQEPLDLGQVKEKLREPMKTLLIKLQINKANTNY